MGTMLFGPFYPALMQTQMNHAERLAHELNRLAYEIAGSEWSDPNDPTESERWLYGRAEEVETVVRDVVREWRSMFLSDFEAATAIERYLEIVHRGFQSAFDLASPGCCTAAVATATHESMTRVSIKGGFPSSRKLLSRIFSFAHASTPTPTCT